MNINLLNGNYYPKPKPCTEKSTCWLCPYYKNNKCSPEDIKNITINDEDKKIIQSNWEKIKKEEHIMEKDDLIKIAKNYGIKITDKLLGHYKSLRLIEPSIMKNKKSLGLGTSGTVGIYKDDTPKLLYTIQNLKKLGIRLKLEDIKYYLDLLKFDEKAFFEIQKIKEEDLHLKKYLSLRGINQEKKNDLMKKYPSYFCETLLSRYDIFEDALTYWLYIDLIEPYKGLDKDSLEFLEIENIINNPDIETNIEEIENVNEAWVMINYDEPIAKNIKKFFI